MRADGVRVAATASAKRGAGRRRASSPCAAVFRVAALGAAMTLAGTQASAPAFGWSQPERAARVMVVTESSIASQVGLEVLREGGSAVDAAVASAFALAVTHPRAGNIGGGGFMLCRAGSEEAVAWDFREKAPAASRPDMFLRDGEYDASLHHAGGFSIGVPGTVAGLHAAWKEHGKLPWKRLVAPAVRLAKEGFPVSDALAQSLREALPELRRHPASLAQFSKRGAPYEPGDVLRQPDLARTLSRIASEGPEGFYSGETADLIVKEMVRQGGLLVREDLRQYRPVKRKPLRGTYRGFEVLAMPPPSSGGVVLLQVLNVLEGFEPAAMGAGSADMVHVAAEALRRAFADRARWLGDPAFAPDMPVARLISKEYAADRRATIRMHEASRSSTDTFDWGREGSATTHLSVVDGERNAVALTTTLEENYGSRIVVTGGGFLLNNEMGDFNAVPGKTFDDGRIGTPPNLAAPGKRMLSSMSPTILARSGRLFMVTGSPGGRTIISTVLQTILNVVDFGMNAQEAVDAPRFHHQWLPDRISFEKHGLSPDTVALLKARGHALAEVPSQGVAQVILLRDARGPLEAGVDRRSATSAAAGY